MNMQLNVMTISQTTTVLTNSCNTGPFDR